MAKVNNSSKHNLQRFFIFFGVLFSLAALGIIVYSSQKPTNTQSDASGSGCGKDPVLSEIRGDGYPKGYARSVEYKMRIKNVDSNSSSGDCSNDRYRISFKLPNDNWKANVLNNANDVITLSEGDSKTFIVKVRRPDGATNGRKNITVRAVNETPRVNGTRAKDTELIGYYVTGNTAGNNDKRTNAPVEKEDDNDSNNCSRDPQVTIVSSKLYNDDGYVPDWANEYRAYIKVKNNCDGKQRYRLSVSPTDKFSNSEYKSQWWIVGWEKEETANITLNGNESRNMQIQLFVPQSNKNYWITAELNGRYPNADLRDTNTVQIQSDGSGHR